jgi:amino acid adenylation domain-containing protein
MTTLSAPAAQPHALPPRLTCLHELLERQADAAPDAIAVRHGDRSVTFATLNRMATHCAQTLRSQGVHREVIVGVCGARSPELLAGLLGVLKAGGGYVPIDASQPSDWIDQALTSAGVTLVLVAGDVGKPAWLDGRTWLPIVDASRHNEHTEMLDAGVTLDNVAVVIHTSGSSGRPKAVALSHRALAARMWARQYKPGDVVCQKAPFAVVAHLSDLLMPVVSGTTVVILDDATIRSTLGLARAMIREGVTRLMLVPSQVRALLENDEAIAQLRRLELLAVSGEAAGAELMAAVRSRLPDVTLLNVYSLSETSGAVAIASFRSGADLVFATGTGGKTYLLDDRLSPVLPGAVGEVYVAADRLARGYLGSAALTAMRFVANPFGTGERLYRTGDLARSGANGTFELLGRRDFEVKVRGFRVNPAELERELERHAHVKHAAVVVGSQDGRGRLTAYVVPSTSGALPEPSVLRAYLAAKFPDYMVPAVFAKIAQMPLLPGGKVDRRALASGVQTLPTTHADGALQSPTQTGSWVASIWSDVLGEPIAPGTNFFDTGGDSLSAMRILARVARRCGVECALQDLIDHPTVAELSLVIDERLGRLAGRNPR